MEECLGVTERPVVYEWIVIWKSENMSRWCNFFFVCIMRLMAAIKFPQLMHKVSLYLVSCILCFVYRARWSYYRRRFGSLLLCACCTCDANCSSAIHYIRLLILLAVNVV